MKSPALPTRLQAGALFLLLIPLAGPGCGGGGTDVVLPSLSITTATTGVVLDPDGYSVQVDGLAAQPIGVQATVIVDQLTDGPHTVTLLGLAPNCSAAENPRAVTVTTGATATVAFAVVCGATTGTLEVVTATSGQPADPDGFVIMLDGAASNPIGPTATVTFPGIAIGVHTVELSGVAPNCQVTGDHPLGVAVEPGETARVTFAINCVATAGGLAVTVSGLPTGTPAAVTVTGPNSFSEAVTGTRSLTGLAPGTYTIAATNVVAGGTTYRPSIASPTVNVVAGGTVAVTVSYTPVAALTLNLRVDGLYITQSSQTYGSTVPLIAGRDAYLRVFVVANEANTARPTVRVRFRNGSSTTERTIAAPGGATPTTVQEGTLGSSWNLPVEAALIRPGLSVEATVDPGGLIPESNETDNSSTKALTVRTVPTARIRFVSVQQGSNAPGNISNPTQLMALARRMHPLNAIEIDVRSGVFTASQPLQADGSGWAQVLGDLNALRLEDEEGEPGAPKRIYFGLAKLAYGRDQGIVFGIAFPPPATTALGWDDPGDASRVVAHELGHIWGRRHSPCGNPPDLDALYPYPGGSIGVYGLDAAPPVTATDLRAPSSPDIMSYCFNSPWVSDYTYQGVMNHRQANASAVSAGLSQPSLLVWGRIVNGRPVLEPAFQIVSRPSLPRRPGPYAVTATAADGTQLFTLSFDATSAEDDPQGSRHFAFAVPLDQARATRLASLRLAGPGGMVATSRPTASLQVGPAGAPVTTRRDGQSVVLQWNGAAHPTIMVRDPDTGEVLSFARGGNARVWTSKGELDLELSDGVKSQRLRVAINRS